MSLADANLHIWTTPGWVDSQFARQLSIVVPFHQYDARPLLIDIVQKMQAHGASVELVFFDDGSRSTEFADALVECMNSAPGAAVMVARSEQNLGRSGARNTLASLAHGKYLVYLDCDMLPDLSDYLERYFSEIEQGETFVYGGRSVARCGDIDYLHRLHWYFTMEREQVVSAIRSLHPEFYFLSSNFLVRKDIIGAIPLDLRFKGWGWEDCEWAFRVNQHHRLKHIDNPATHLGLITLTEIQRKYIESVDNFLLVLKVCPSLVAHSSLLKVARLLSALRISRPTVALVDYLLHRRWTPLSFQIRLLQLYKAALYARRL